MSDTTDLRATAAAATPGPWTWSETGNSLWGGSRGMDDVLRADDDGKPYGMHSATIDSSDENRAYIAAADPTTVLALLDDLAAVTAEREKWTPLLTGWTPETLAEELQQHVDVVAALECGDGYDAPADVVRTLQSALAAATERIAELERDRDDERRWRKNAERLHAEREYPIVDDVDTPPCATTEHGRALRAALMDTRDLLREALKGDTMEIAGRVLYIEQHLSSYVDVALAACPPSADTEGK